jgi:hypothetical protein
MVLNCYLFQVGETARGISKKIVIEWSRYKVTGHFSYDLETPTKTVELVNGRIFGE